MKLAPILALLCAVTLSAHAQWQWLDNNGKKVFSDRPPSPEVPEKNILKQPAGTKPSAPQQLPESAPSVTPATKPGMIKLPARDPQLEAKKKQSEMDEAARKKTADEKMAQTRQQNCERGRAAVASLQTGARTRIVNARGELEFMDDNARSAELERAQDIVNTQCQ